MTDRQLFQQALDALNSPNFGVHSRAILALQERLAQPEQEPVAIALNTGTKQGVKWLKNVEHGWALYTNPPAAQRTWVGLTKADINEIWKGEPMLLPWDMTRALAIEQRLKEKNNG